MEPLPTIEWDTDEFRSRRAHLAEQIALARHRHDITQRQMADELGINPTLFNKYLNGERDQAFSLGIIDQTEALLERLVDEAMAQ